MFLLNSRLSLFSAACLRRHPFSQSYGVILPSSLTRVIPLILGFSPRLPVSVCGTGGSHSLAAFLASVNSAASLLLFGPHHRPASQSAYFTTLQPHDLHRVYQHPALPILLCHCLGQTCFASTGISTSCPSPTTIVLGLGPD